MLTLAQSGGIRDRSRRAEGPGAAISAHLQATETVTTTTTKTNLTVLLSGTSKLVFVHLAKAMETCKAHVGLFKKENEGNLESFTKTFKYSIVQKGIYFSFFVNKLADENS